MKQECKNCKHKFVCEALKDAYFEEEASHKSDKDFFMIQVILSHFLKTAMTKVCKALNEKK